jgi:hypothetical protein
MTTTYGVKPQADPVHKDVYLFTIYKNMYTTRAFEDEHLKGLIMDFMAEHGYRDYKIIRTESGILVNKDIFHIRFYRHELR